MMRFLLLMLWLTFGTFCLVSTARKMGYLRWSDLGPVPFGPIWLATPFWWNERGIRLWIKKL